MADKSPIEWTDATWNPIVGCSIVSPGCTRCYAMKMAGRIEAMAAVRPLSAMGVSTHYAGTTKKVNGNTVWTGKVALAPDHILLQPLAWRAPRRIFVNSMGDLFHEDVPDEWIDKVFAVMALAPQHTFQVLTKRARRMRDYFAQLEGLALRRREFLAAYRAAGGSAELWLPAWPLPNVWLGVSAERQQEADERIPDLLATPAAIRFVSAEPLLGPIDFERVTRQPNDDDERMPGLGTVTQFYVDALSGAEGIAYRIAGGPETFAENRGGPALDWIIAGGESGDNARAMHPAWARSIRDQCADAGVSFFFKQWGEWTPGENVQRQSGVVETAEWFADKWLFSSENLARNDGHIDDEPDVYRVGKKAAGRLLDGVEHNDMPELREVKAL